MAEKTTIQSVAKAMRLLDVLAEAGHSLSLTELYQKTGWPRSTIFGLLSTMRESRIVTQNTDGKYALGLRLFELGNCVSSSWDISSIAKPYMDRLRRDTEASVVLSLYDSGHVLVMDQAAGHGSFQIIVQPGSQLPLHATSQGKLFLSAQTESNIALLLGSDPLQLYTPHSLIAPELIRQELDQIRQQGYAVENGEYKIGLRSVSAPIYTVDGVMQYSLSVIGMFRRIQSDEFQNAIGLTVQAAERISAALGYRKGE